MTREEAKKLLPIIQAYSEGKAIECRTTPSALVGDVPNGWTEMKEIEFWNNTEYRVKVEPIYRPFKDIKECCNEMLKHQPFGWVKENECDGMENISHISSYGPGTVHFAAHGSEDSADIAIRPGYSLSVMFEVYSFADGTPFGIRTEE